jgi:hypothetical protein
LVSDSSTGIYRCLTSYRRFPKARVWPPLPPSAAEAMSAVTPNVSALVNSAASTSAVTLSLPGPSFTDGDLSGVMPDLALQEHLLQIYFTHVHSAFPVLHKEAFMESFRE